VKLLFDQNLSPRLCNTLRSLWPDIVHVRDVWLRAGNCSTAEIEKLLRGQEREIVAFVDDPESTLLVVSF
jgi:predicted nuclease of predicted toxin-antitoxin system